jgi:hypothetical protein
MSQYDMGRSRNRKKISQIVNKVKAEGVAVGYLELARATSHICQTNDFTWLVDKWNELLSEPVTPKNPLIIDLDKRLVSRGAGDRRRPAWPMTSRLPNR